MPFASRNVATIVVCKYWSPSGATSMGYNFGHQVELLALIANLATRRCHLHQLQMGPPNGTTCIGSKFSSARVTSVKSQKPLLEKRQTPGPKDRTPDTWVG